MDKIPDVVKSLREFSGQPGEFSSWKKSVDRILKAYESLKGTPKYYGILSVIRNKITGCADTALESYNTPLNWERIAKCLTLHYADKRDLGTLEYQMTTLIQRNNTIPEFYQEVYYHLSLILNKLSSMDMSQESLNVMTQAYRDKALDTFIRGLKGDLPRLLSMREPVDLPEALHLCLKLENVHYRVQHSHGSIRSPQFSLPPPRPPKPFNLQQRQQSLQRKNFYPELLHNPSRPFFPKPQYQSRHPQQQYPQQYHQQFQRPFNGNNFSKPEPMDIDQSIRSRQVNYMNRPAQQPLNKRPHSNQVHQPAKFQRIFHTNQSAVEPNLEQYQEEIANYDEGFEQTLEAYSDPQESTEQLDDIHFLD